jgi:hypothetical protein
MNAVKSMALGLFRPAKAIDGAAAALKWMWVPLVLVLVTSAAARAAVNTPLQFAEQQEIAQEQFKEEMASMPKEERVAFEEDQAIAEEFPAEAEGIVSTAAMVFAVIGAVAAVAFTALFFFLAAKTWASPAAFTTMLSIASLSMVPLAFRNFVQAAYMSATSEWLRHAGLGDLVAPAQPDQAPGVLYAFLSQVDIWAIWGVAILFGALCATALGIGRKRAIAGVTTFVAIAAVVQAVPTLIAGAFMAGM